MKRSGQPPLSIVGSPPATSPHPARALGAPGMQLWRRVTGEFEIDDSAGIELLTLGCEMLDRAEELAACIRADGATVRTPTGIKAHPLLKEELAARSFVARSIARLGLNLEPTRATSGRPPKGGA